MSGEALQVTKVYRHLLRAIKKHVAKEDKTRHFKEYVTEEFRNNSKLSDPSSIQQKIKLAHNYTYMLNSVHHHQDLLFSYNIAVDRADEMKRVLGKSAASVGLQLPEIIKLLYSDEEANQLKTALAELRELINLGFWKWSYNTLDYRKVVAISEIEGSFRTAIWNLWEPGRQAECEEDSRM